MKKTTNIFFLKFFPLLTFLLMSFSIRASSIESLEVSLNNTSLKYNSPQRLSRVLLDSYQLLDYAPYSLGASLITKEYDDSFAKKTTLINRVTSQKTNSSENLISLLDEFTFYDREKITLDLERIQLDPKLNPFIKGEYKLSLPKRPNHITIIDPLNSKHLIKVPIKYNYDFEDYINFYKDGFNIKNKIKLEKITIVQADKETIIPKVSYWNDKNYYLSPGAFLYIGIESSPQINSDFIDLLKYHVVF